jgi:hypothetical protein
MRTPLFHDAQHLLVVDRESPAVELTRHPAVSIAGVLLDDRLDAIHEALFIVGLVL